jgi:hypothetical protein
MKFKIDTSGFFYSVEEAKKLEDLGFTFEKYEYRGHQFHKTSKLIEIEINSLDELLKFVKEYGPIILKEDEIEIYDNYRE